MSRAVDPHALTDADIRTLAQYLARAAVAGVAPLGEHSVRVVNAIVLEAVRLESVDETRRRLVTK